MNTSVSVFYPIDRAPARRDLATGAAVALALLAGATWYGNAAKRAFVPPAPASHHLAPVPVPPPIDLSDPTVDLTPAPSETPSPTVVRQVDVPAPPTANPFVEPPEPTQAVVNYDSHATVVPPGGYFRPGEPAYDPNALDQIPEATFQSAPAYPYDLKRAGISGTVLVDFIVEANGTTSHLTATGGSAEFRDSAVQAVAHWRFHPGRKLGRAVRTHMVVPVRFSLATDS